MHFCETYKKCTIELCLHFKTLDTVGDTFMQLVNN